MPLPNAGSTPRERPWVWLVRTLGIASFHVRRALGLPTGQAALLASRAGPWSVAWLVRLASADPSLPSDGRPGEGFEIRRRHVGDVVVVRPASGSGVPPAGPGRWILLAGGHARSAQIEDVSPGDRLVTLRLGDEHVAEISGQDVLEPHLDTAPSRQALLALYTELGAQHRALVDVRFKLLALVPAVSALALVGIVTPTGPFAEAPRAVRVCAAVLGLLVVLGVRVYDVRNSELHDDLVSRGRSTEVALGVRYGVFARRRRPVAPVQHDLALHLIYGAVLAAWVGAVVAAVVAPAPGAEEPAEGDCGTSEVAPPRGGAPGSPSGD